MKIVIEQGKAGLWYASTEEYTGLYRGILVAGSTMELVIDALPAAFKDLRDAEARQAEKK
jgi:hypothetical protein